MHMPLSRVAVAFAALVAAASAAPLTASVAETPIPSPNTINNATVEPAITPHVSAGIYDIEDQYKDSKGFPLPGWEYLARPPS
jgi:hypothetical protein